MTVRKAGGPRQQGVQQEQEGQAQLDEQTQVLAQLIQQKTGKKLSPAELSQLAKLGPPEQAQLLKQLTAPMPLTDADIPEGNADAQRMLGGPKGTPPGLPSRSVQTDNYIIVPNQETAGFKIQGKDGKTFTTRGSQVISETLDSNGRPELDAQDKPKFTVVHDFKWNQPFVLADGTSISFRGTPEGNIENLEGEIEITGASVTAKDGTEIPGKKENWKLRSDYFSQLNAKKKEVESLKDQLKVANANLAEKRNELSEVDKAVTGTGISAGTGAVIGGSIGTIIGGITTAVLTLGTAGMAFLPALGIGALIAGGGTAIGAAPGGIATAAAGITKGPIAGKVKDAEENVQKLEEDLKKEEAELMRVSTAPYDFQTMKEKVDTKLKPAEEEDKEKEEGAEKPKKAGAKPKTKEVEEPEEDEEEAEEEPKPKPKPKVKK